METDVTPHTLSVVELRFDFAREGFTRPSRSPGRPDVLLGLGVPSFHLGFD